MAKRNVAFYFVKLKIKKQMFNPNFHTQKNWFFILNLIGLKHAILTLNWRNNWSVKM